MDEINMILLTTTLVAFILSGLWEMMGEIIYDIEVKNRYVIIFKLLLVYILSCPKCVTFWFTLICTFNPLIAAVTAINVMVLKQLEAKYFPTILK